MENQENLVPTSTPKELNSSSKLKKRNAGLDLIRVAACFFVILVHASAEGFYRLSDFWDTCVKFDASARMAVPLFFMLSGYLLFNGRPTENLGYFFKKRFSRILLPFVTVMIIYYFYHRQSWTVSDWFSRYFCKGTMTDPNLRLDYHLWFMYALIGLYLAVPLFDRLFTNESGLNIVRFYVAIWLVSSVFYEYANNYFGWNINPFKLINCNYFFGFMGFLFLGGLFRRINVTAPWRWVLLVICIASSCYIYYLTKINSIRIGLPYEMFFDNFCPFVVLQAVSFFLAVKDISFNSRLITFIAQHTYWMYLLHLLVMFNFQRITGIWIYENTAWHIPLISVSTFILVFLISIPLYRLEQYVALKLKLR